MSTELISLIANWSLSLIIFLFALLSALSIYILVRYGRTRSVTIAVSTAFVVLFILQSLAAFASVEILLKIYAS